MTKRTKMYIVLTLCVSLLLLTASQTSVISVVKGNLIFNPYIIVDQNVGDHLWSPDGTKIAYVKCPSGQYWDGELWVADWNGREISNQHLIYTGIEWNRLEDWKDGWILFMMRHEPGTPSSYYGMRELWKIREDGTDLTQITFTYSNGIRTTWWNPAYTNMGTVGWGHFIPGTDLVYFSAHNGNGWYRPIVCNADGTDGWYYVSSHPNYFSFTIGMSPTGNKLVWGHATYWDNPTKALMASNVDGSGKATIGSFPYRTTPLVLADGNTVIYNFIRTRGIGEPPLAGNIYAMDIDGSNKRTVLDDEFYNYRENYKPVDGQALVMRSNRDPDGNWHFFTLNVDGTGIEQLTEGPYDDYAPIYSPNGHNIMYRRLPEDFVPTTGQPYPYELVIKRIVMHITIDIKPGSDPNSINLKSRGVTPVAVLTTEDFDASTVDPVTLQFAGASPLRWALEDVDADGDLDLILHFKTQELALTKDSTDATLTGETFDWVLIEGTDSVRIVPPKDVSQ